MKGNYEYKKATIADIDELVRTRIIVLRAANKLSNDMDMSLVEKESYEYYKNALETGEHIAYLVYDNETFIGAGGVSFYKVMPTYHTPMIFSSQTISGSVYIRMTVQCWKNP